MNVALVKMKPGSGSMRGLNLTAVKPARFQLTDYSAEVAPKVNVQAAAVACIGGKSPYALYKRHLLLCNNKGCAGSITAWAPWHLTKTSGNLTDRPRVRWNAVLLGSQSRIESWISRLEAWSQSSPSASSWRSNQSMRTKRDGRHLAGKFFMTLLLAIRITQIL
jgi:hypothetical protein